MIGTDLNHCQIVNESINSERCIDEQTFASLAILSERLEGLKKASPAFASVSFSPALENLAKQKKTMAVC